MGRRCRVKSPLLKESSAGLQRHLTQNKRGKVVSKRASANGDRAHNNLKPWNFAVAKARQALGLHGFVPIGGKSHRGKALYLKAKEFYAQRESVAHSSTAVHHSLLQIGRREFDTSLLPHIQQENLQLLDTFSKGAQSSADEALAGRDIIEKGLECVLNELASLGACAVRMDSADAQNQSGPGCNTTAPMDLTADEGLPMEHEAPINIPNLWTCEEGSHPVLSTPRRSPRSVKASGLTPDKVGMTDACASTDCSSEKTSSSHTMPEPQSVLGSALRRLKSACIKVNDEVMKEVAMLRQQTRTQQQHIEDLEQCCKQLEERLAQTGTLMETSIHTNAEEALTRLRDERAEQLRGFAEFLQRNGLEYLDKMENVKVRDTAAQFREIDSERQQDIVEFLEKLQDEAKERAFVQDTCKLSEARARATANELLAPARQLVEESKSVMAGLNGVTSICDRISEAAANGLHQPQLQAAALADQADAKLSVVQRKLATIQSRHTYYAKMQEKAHEAWNKHAAVCVDAMEKMFSLWQGAVKNYFQDLHFAASARGA